MATEKLDGTSATFFMNAGEFGVCSRNWELKDLEGNAYWQIARENGLEAKMRKLGHNLAIQGEIVGPGIQGNSYKLIKPTLYVFNIFDIDAKRYVSFDDLRDMCNMLHLSVVPFVAEMHLSDLSTKAELLAYAESKSKLADVEREGVVFYQFDLSTPYSRRSFKAISNRWLLKQKD
jgi:RNA ligase (TIGR02306 family)